MLKGGIIGLGRMGLVHFSILNTHPDIKIEAVCDNSKLVLSTFKKYVDVDTFSDYKEMIEKSDLDFVVISTPTSSHTEIANVAISNNIHIFMEKPFTMNAAEGKEILKLINGKALVNQVGYVNRFNEVFLQIKKHLDEKLIGEVQHFKFEMLSGTVLRDTKTGWRGKKKFGGGCLYEFASHCIDLAIYLVGQPDNIVGGVLQSVYSSNVEDIVSSTFLYNNGCSGTILVNWSDASYRKPTNRIEIFGKQGKITADRQSYKIFLNQDDKKYGFHKGWNTRYITDLAEGVRFYVRGNEFTRQLDYFIDCIKKKRTENVSSFAEALKADIVMEAIINDYKKRMPC